METTTLQLLFNLKRREIAVLNQQYQAATSRIYRAGNDNSVRRACNETTVGNWFSMYKRLNWKRNSI